jgi:glycosyltransferase involved in cell wall biosynthesis
MKIIILTQYYPPEHGAPQNRLHDLSKRWVKEGHEVTVLTAMPNYPKGEIFPEYKNDFLKEESIDGARVVRTWIFATKKKSTILMLLSYFSFVFTSIIGGLTTLKKSDFIICESPPLFLGFSALVLKLATGSKLVMNISDLWPESAVQLGLIGPGLPLRMLEIFEEKLYRYSVFVSCQTEGIKHGVVKRYRAAKTLLFPNGVDLDMFPEVEKDVNIKKEYSIPEDCFLVGYGGNHGRSQALGQVLDAAEQLKNGKIFFAFYGDGPEKEELIKRAETKGLKNVGFYPSEPRQKMYIVQSVWDIAVVPLKNIELFDGARPSKMFELMAGKIPFIFCGKGEGADLALNSGCAKVVPPENTEKLVEAIVSMSKETAESLKTMGENGRNFVAKNFDRAKLCNIFLNELKKYN